MAKDTVRMATRLIKKPNIPLFLPNSLPCCFSIRRVKVYICPLKNRSLKTIV